MKERYTKHHNLLINYLLKDLKESKYITLDNEIKYDKILGYNKDQSNDPSKY